MYTANTMATAIEAMGMALPDSASIPAEHPDKLGECRRAGEVLLQLPQRDPKPRDSMTRRAFGHALVVIMALGGSTNAVLHLIAMAPSVGVALEPADFQGLSPNSLLGRPQAEWQIRAGRPPLDRRYQRADEVPA